MEIEGSWDGSGQGRELIRIFPDISANLILLVHSHCVNKEIEKLPHYSLIIGLYIQRILPW